MILMAKKGDWIEIEYTGTIKEDNIVFDTTDVEVARTIGLYDEKMEERLLQLRRERM